MRKIKTLFKKNLEDLSRVTTELDPDCAWALETGIPTIKWDGTSCAVIYGSLYRRYDCKNGKKPPEGSLPCQEPDPITGHWPHWVLCVRGNPQDQYHFEAFDYAMKLVEGSYELIGPKIQGNPYNLTNHRLVEHGVDVINHTFTDYEDIREYLSTHRIEGIVFWDPEFNNACKIRASDFGINWKEIRQ